jgi:HEAT repeat protein
VIFGVRPERTIEGRTVQSWLRDVAHGQGRDRDAAVEVFARNGRRTVPDLIPIIEWRSSRLMRWVRASPYIFDRLPARLQTWTSRKADGEPFERVWAVEMCSLIGPGANDAHRALTRACADPSPDVRAAATQALVKTHVAPASGVPILVQMLSDSNMTVRGRAAVALGLYGDSAKAAVPALRTAAAKVDATAAFEFQLGLTMIEHPEKVKAIGKNGYRLLP